jgi:hypothetical protein
MKLKLEQVITEQGLIELRGALEALGGGGAEVTGMSLLMGGGPSGNMALKGEHLRKGYGRRWALSDLSFTVSPLGPSSAVWPTRDCAHSSKAVESADNRHAARVTNDSYEAAPPLEHRHARRLVSPPTAAALGRQRSEESASRGS